MNEFRSALKNGERPAGPSPVARKEPCRRRRGEGAGLLDIAVARQERRSCNQRREDRYGSLADHATIRFRGKRLLARVVNMSGTGLMVECALMPRIGETLKVRFEGFDPIDGVVRWVKRGRIGLDVGEGAIVIDRE